MYFSFPTGHDSSESTVSFFQKPTATIRFERLLSTTTDGVRWISNPRRLTRGSVTPRRGDARVDDARRIENLFSLDPSPRYLPASRVRRRAREGHRSKDARDDANMPRCGNGSDDAADDDGETRRCDEGNDATARDGCDGCFFGGVDRAIAFGRSVTTTTTTRTTTTRMTTGATVFFKLTPLVGWCACARASEHTRARCVRGAVSDVLTRSHSLRTGLDARTRRRVDP